MINLWIDSAFSEQKGASGGASITTFTDSMEPVGATTWQYVNMAPGLAITRSTDAELMTTLLALEQAGPDTIRKLYFDCDHVDRQFQNMKGPLKDNETITPFRKRFIEALARQPRLETWLVKRNIGNIPKADAFAAAAAYGDKNKIAVLARTFCVPHYYLIKSNGLALEL
jgi:hypothetical protein